MKPNAEYWYKWMQPFNMGLIQNNALDLPLQSKLQDYKGLHLIWDELDLTLAGWT